MVSAQLCSMASMLGRGDPDTHPLLFKGALALAAGGETHAHHENAANGCLSGHNAIKLRFVLCVQNATR